MFLVSNIREHMEIVGSDNVYVGTVDRMEGDDRIRLTGTNAPGGRKFLPTHLVERVDDKVRLKVPAGAAPSQFI